MAPLLGRSDELRQVADPKETPGCKRCQQSRRATGTNDAEKLLLAKAHRAQPRSTQELPTIPRTRDGCATSFSIPAGAVSPPSPGYLETSSAQEKSRREQNRKKGTPSSVGPRQRRDQERCDNTGVNRRGTFNLVAGREVPVSWALYPVQDPVERLTAIPIFQRVDAPLSPLLRCSNPRAGLRILEHRE